MLLPSERSQAIQILTNNAANGDFHYHGSQAVRDMLMYGFKGFAQFSDKELLRAIQTLGKKTGNFEVQNFISTISADRFMLE